MNSSEMAPWEAELQSCTSLVDAMRKRYVEQLQPLFGGVLERLTSIQDVTLGYQRGWSDDLSLLQALQRDNHRDVQHGSTHSGPHRADLDLRVAGRPADEVLSRGQEKLLVCALRIAQGELLNRLTGKTCVYLVDDLPAELDLQHRQALCKQLASINCQLFITATDPDSLAGCWDNIPSVRWFHVEQGRINEYLTPPG